MQDNRLSQAFSTTCAAVFPDRQERIAALRAELERLGASDPAPKEKLLTTREACEEIDCTSKTLHNYERRGLVRGIRISPRRVRWSLAGYRAALGEGKVVAHA